MSLATSRSNTTNLHMTQTAQLVHWLNYCWITMMHGFESKLVEQQIFSPLAHNFCL